MKIRHISLWIFPLVLMVIPLLGLSLEEEDAHSAGCLPNATVQDQSSACASCHKDNASRWESSQHRPCTPYCVNCHTKTEMSRHHHVGIELPRVPDEVLKLTADMKLACFTCHDLSRPRYDSVRWKASSLYDRIFRSEKRYKTYFLSKRNDEGQLCLTCH